MTELRSGECLACEPLLAAYVDGEVAARDQDRVTRHLEGCAVCRDWLARERAAREALRARRDTLRGCAPERLKARCAAYAARHAARTAGPAGSRRLRPAAIARWMPLSAAAALLLAVAAVFGLGITSKVEALALQATFDHITCTRFNVPNGPVNPLDIAAGWQTKAGWPLRLPASSEPKGLQLRGVRRCAVTEGRVAHLMYTWMGEPLSVYVLPKRTLRDTTEFVRRFKHQSAMWSQSDRTYIIVTGRPRDGALDDVVSYVRAAAY